MTRPFSSLPLQPIRGGLRYRASLLGCSLVWLVAGCAERFDIGAFQGTQPQFQTGDIAPSSPGIGMLLADGVEDADAVLDGVAMVWANDAGDLDGDGFDDMIVTGTDAPSSQHILYGGPRPTDGVVRLARRSTALGLDEYYFSTPLGFPWRGDFDGDGADDLVISARDRGFYTYGLSGEAAAEQEAALADLMQRWTELRAFLWYGGPERPAQVEFPSDAVALQAGDDLSGDLARVLEAHDPRELEANINLGSSLEWLGDIDGDGLGDLALSTGFSVDSGYEEVSSDGVASFSARSRRIAVSYLYYGGARLEVGGEVRPPDARLPGVSLAGLGDVNGDGLADVVAEAVDGSMQLDVGDAPPRYLLTGSAQRLVGEVAVQDLGVPIQLSSTLTPLGVGDLDGDEISDLLIWQLNDEQRSFHIVYGSPDFFQRPLDAARVSATFSDRSNAAEMYNAGDYDGDGMSDLLIYKSFWEYDDDPLTPDRGSDQTRFLPGGTPRYAGTYDLDVIQPSREPRNGWYSVLANPVGDFDGDGRADLAISEYPNADVRIKFGATQPGLVVR